MHNHCIPLVLALCLGSTACEPKVDDSAAIEGDADTDADADTDTDVDTGPVDQDGDGVPAWQDCDDGDASVGGPSTWYADGDQDGWGDDGSTTTACDQPSGHVGAVGDCDDGDPRVNPDATEVCNGLDDDCDGLVDDEDDSLDLATRSTFYEDGDGDGWGLDASTTEACAAPDGWAEQGGDCDDGDADINPDVWDVIDGVDNDCDGTADVISLADADVVLEGDVAYDYAGFGVTGGHDLDGDGVVDLMLGASCVSTTLWDVGEVYVVPGPIATSGSLSSLATATVTGLAAYDFLGEGHDVLGDLDGDGHEDVLIGTYGLGSEDPRTNPAEYHVFAGPLSGALTTADARFTLESDLFLENRSSLAGDTDGDGLQDLIVSSSEYQRVWVVAGADLAGTGTLDVSDLATPIAWDEDIDRFGFAVTGLGDIDADGLADIAVGAPFHDTDAGASSGAVYVFTGGASWPTAVTGAHATLLGSVNREGLGWSLEGGTDLDGDDLPDVLIGAFDRDVDPANSNGGLLVAPGASLQGVLTDAFMDVLLGAAGEHVGSSVAVLGDIDADGAIEIGTWAQGDKYLGTPWPSYYVAEVPTGTTDTASAELLFQPTDSFSSPGASTRGVGDLNGDGIDDIAIADVWATTTAPQTGAVYLFYGK